MTILLIVSLILNLIFIFFLIQCYNVEKHNLRVIARLNNELSIVKNNYAEVRETLSNTRTNNKNYLKKIHTMRDELETLQDDLSVYRLADETGITYDQAKKALQAEAEFIELEQKREAEDKAKRANERKSTSFVDDSYNNDSYSSGSSYGDNDSYSGGGGSFSGGGAGGDW